MTVILHDLKNCCNIEHEAVWRVMQLFDKNHAPTCIIIDTELKQFFYENENYMLLKVTEY